MLLKLAIRNVFRSRGRFFLSAFVVTVASLLLVYATGQIAGVNQALANGMSDTLTGHIQIKPRSAPQDFFEYSSARRLELIPDVELNPLLSSLSSLEAVEAVSHRIRFGTLIGDDERSVPALVMAVDPAVEGTVTPDLGTLLEPMTDPQASLLAPYLAAKLDKDVGDEILVFTETPGESFNAQAYRIAALAEAPVLIDEFMNSLLVIDLTRARQLLYLDGGASEIVVRLKPGYREHPEAVVDQIQALLSDAQQDYLAVYPYTQVAKAVGNISGIAASIGAIQVGTVMLVMLVIVLIVTRMSLHERRAEIGTLMSLGMTRTRLTTLFLYEVMIKILIGFGSGLLLALLMLQGVRESGGIKAVTEVDQYLYGGKVMFPVIDGENILLGFLIVMGAALLVTLGSCWKASGQDPVALLASKR